MKLLKNIYIVDNHLGYLYNNKLFIKDFGKKTWSRRELGLHNTAYTNDRDYHRDFMTELLVTNKIQIRIKDYKESARIFGFKPTKRKLHNTKTLDYRFKGFIDKKDYHGHIVEILDMESKKWIKFCEEDLELILPDFSKYKEIKIEKGTIIRCKNDKSYKGFIRKSEKLGVVDIVAINKYNKKPHIIEVINENFNKYKVYRKDFLVI